MPSIITTVPNADFSGLGLGLADTPFSVRPWAGYVLGAKHVEGTDYTNLQDFCGTQGDLVPTGNHAPADYAEPVGTAVYYDTPFTMAEHFAAGGGSASMVIVARPALAANFFGGKIAAGSARFYSQALVQASPAMSASAVVYDDDGNTVSFSSAIPGADGSAQYSMIAHAVTPTSIRGLVQNINGASTAAAIAKSAGTYTAPVPYRLGSSQGVGNYPGPVNEVLALFFSGNQYAYFPTLYQEIKAWLNEHGMGL